MDKERQLKNRALLNILVGNSHVTVNLMQNLCFVNTDVDSECEL